MLTITKAGVVATVSSGAYRDFYKAMGWVPCEPTSSLFNMPEDAMAEQAEQTEETMENEAEEVEEQEISLAEIPLSQMSKKQLKDYAAEVGVDISDTKSAQEARDKIKAALNS